MSSVALNRVTETKTKRYIAGGTNDWQWTKISHQIDAIGRTSVSNYRQWLAGGSEPAGDSLEHVYDQAGRMVQNYDGTSSYGQNWHWAGTANSHNGPLYSPAADTASQVNHNIGAASFKGIPVRRSFSQPTVEGDKRELFGQGRPQAKDSVAAWATGISSDPQNIAQGTAESRFSFIGTVSSTDMSRATDSREAGRVGIFGSALSYGGSYGRVTNEAIGRDVNPIGRGDGRAYVAGQMDLGQIQSQAPGNLISIGQNAIQVVGKILESISLRGMSVLVQSLLERGLLCNSGNSANNAGQSSLICSSCVSRADMLSDPRSLMIVPGSDMFGVFGHSAVDYPYGGPIAVSSLGSSGGGNNPDMIGDGNTMDQACYAAWKASIRDEWQCLFKQWVNCPCDSNCSLRDWEMDPAGCMVNFCACKTNSKAPACADGEFCGRTPSGKPCCPIYCIKCNSKSHCSTPCVQSVIDDWNQALEFALAILAGAIAGCILLGGIFFLICILAALAAFLLFYKTQCDSTLSNMMTFCSLSMADACACMPCASKHCRE